MSETPQRRVRPYNKSEEDTCGAFQICLKTGDAGKDATHLFKDHKIIGYRWVGGYLALQPELCFLLEDDEGICGYVLAALDSKSFYKKLQEEYLPSICQKEGYKCPPTGPEGLSLEDWYLWSVHHPEIHFTESYQKTYPSHLHIDILPRGQKQGYGRKMMDVLNAALKAQGSVGVHLQMAKTNENAKQFYLKLGFKILDEVGPDLFLGLAF